MSIPPREYTHDESNAFIELTSIPPLAEGPLAGKQFAVKDSIDIKGFKTTLGNNDWGKHAPIAAVHANCVEILLRSGASCMGKTVCDELTIGFSGINTQFEIPMNPHAPDRVPGGSSSGSASAVACGLADFALASDSGGSTRVPAAHCGLFGFRPTTGLISMGGVARPAPSYDTVGLLARTREDLIAPLLQLIGMDLPSKTTVGRVLLVKEAFDASSQEVLDALDAPLSKILNHFDVREVSIDLSLISEVMAEIQQSEGASTFGGWFQTERPKLHPRVDSRFHAALVRDRSTLLDAIYKEKTLFMELSSLIVPGDLICMPTLPMLAPKIAELQTDEARSAYADQVFSFMALGGLGRMPQVSLPVGNADGVPVGLSLLAKHGQDAFLLSAIERIIE